LGLACKKGMQYFVGLGQIWVANNCGQGSDFAWHLSKGKCEERCIIVFFWSRKFRFCLWVGYCIGPNLTMGNTWTWGMAKTKPYFHCEIWLYMFFIYLSFFLSFWSFLLKFIFKCTKMRSVVWHFEFFFQINDNLTTLIKHNLKWMSTINYIK
jgi:hypothetical protein